MNREELGNRMIQNQNDYFKKHWFRIKLKFMWIDFTCWLEKLLHFKKH